MRGRYDANLAWGVMQTACQKNQLIDTVEIPSLDGSWVSVVRHDSCLRFPTAPCALYRRGGSKGLFSKVNGNVAHRRQRDLERKGNVGVGIPWRERNPYKTRKKAV